jgi:GNAT superfamily N-acetyltransferase
MMIRPVESDRDLAAWVAVKNAVVPNEPATVEQVRNADEEGRILLLAEEGGATVGCAVAGLSNLGGKAFIAVRVLPEWRRRGIGRALFDVCAAHARSLGRDGVNAFVYADEPHSVAFAESLGLADVDYQLEQVRAIGDEPPVETALELRALGADRDALLERVWDEVAVEAYEDLPLPGEVTYRREAWLREEATRPDGSFVAFEDGAIVGYAGLGEHANGDAIAEHGLTAVRRDRRRRGIARALKRAQLHWAAQNGVTEFVTWTQKGNEGMQALNHSLGYVDKSKVITFQGPLP